MPATRPTRPLHALAFTAVLAGLLAAAPAAQAQAPAVQAAQAGPAAAEVEFWRSTEHLGTAEAYAAYLAAYPSGHYAALARLAMGGKAPAPSTSPAPAAPMSPEPPLRHFSAAAGSSAITFRVGDRLSSGIKLADQRAGAEAMASLERLGASFDGPALISVWYYAQRQYGYLRVSRIDWLHATYGNDSGPAAGWQPPALPASAERQAHAQALLRWVDGYRLLAASGFTRALDLEDLQPGQPAEPEGTRLPWVDVAWPVRQPVPQAR